ncbi:MAG: hypothetical protein A2Z99_09830 [Treponema sp. GWB1_62_6]|nr:MAG: hypothetical protein A2Y36_12800 [Treponema sp. GWA1_62_8]OHE68977.1 MAG: hypothetical protein A2Z99_09830 [Treponema sp. GWB1_62_6]OHE70128.1 MAG: hypothetical protein A2001_02750 [Treponema sp. GWC1_61_84]OHE71233.1 MAG: hypothetical protein A2413_06795 [Treponema sp. RIFOXYC1_FULL_61_9]HCM25546.1 hypothetical protein [Treponema sp.]
MEAAICIEMLFPGMPAVEKIAEIARRGFTNTEFWGWRDKDIEGIASLLREKNLRVVNFSGARKGDLIDRKEHPLVLRDLEESILAAGRLGTSVLMLLSNELGEGGRVLRPRAEIPETGKRAALVEGLALAAEKLPAGMTLVLEPLNTALDHPGYYLADLGAAASIVREVGDPRLKLLCDFYHQGMMGDDLGMIVDSYLDDIGHIHIADFPGRNEPGTGRGKWLPLLRRIGERGWDGFVGFEYSPKDDSGESLARIRELWDLVEK